MASKGRVHVYCGEGKGKTTAALGLSLRALGAGKSVYIGHFVKGRESSEHKILSSLSDVTYELLGMPGFIRETPSAEDIQCATIGLNKVREILKSGKYNVVVLDEANIALYYRLFTFNELKEAIDGREESVEVIITGRKLMVEMKEYADLVTEMREVKHYYSLGQDAREGIEY